MLDLDETWNRDLAHSPFRLRFELNSGGPYVTMFATAYDRARTLARAALGVSDLIAIVAGDPDGWATPWAEERYGVCRDSPFAALTKMGIDSEAPLATWHASPYPHRDDIGRWEHRALRVTWSEADILLWSNIAQEIGVRPAAPVQATLVDRENAIAVLAYDDRGMDVTALAPEEIALLYERFDAWLLDHDRPRTAAALA